MNTKTLLTSLLLLTSAGVFAQTAEKKELPVRKLQVPAFTKLAVKASVKVLLIQDKAPGAVYLVGEPAGFDDIDLKVEKDELVISVPKQRDYKSSITIEVHVKDLSKVNVQNEAIVFSGNILSSKKINVYLAPGSKASIQSTGDINIASEEDTELVFLRKTAGVTVVNR